MQNTSSCRPLTYCAWHNNICVWMWIYRSAHTDHSDSHYSYVVCVFSYMQTFEEPTVFVKHYYFSTATHFRSLGCSQNHEICNKAWWKLQFAPWLRCRAQWWSQTHTACLQSSLDVQRFGGSIANITNRPTGSQLFGFPANISNFRPFGWSKPRERCTLCASRRY